MKNNKVNKIQKDQRKLKIKYKIFKNNQRIFKLKINNLTKKQKI